MSPVGLDPRRTSLGAFKNFRVTALVSPMRAVSQQSCMNFLNKRNKLRTSSQLFSDESSTSQSYVG